MIKNYDDFVEKVIRTYVEAYAIDIWEKIKKIFEQMEPRTTLIHTMNEVLRKHRQEAETFVNSVLNQIDGLAKNDKDELGYEMLNRLTERMKVTLWEFYWDDQLENLTKNLDLNFAVLED